MPTTEQRGEANTYTRETVNVDDPTALIDGHLQLRIGGVAFALYLQSTDGITEARLLSRELRVADAVKREARAFLDEVAARVAAERG